MVFGESQDMIRTHFQKEADKVRMMKTNWGLFTRTKMIAQSDYDFIVTYEQADNEKERSEVLNVFKEKVVITGDELDYFMGSLKETITRGTSNDYIATAVRCMQTLFRFNHYRVSFVNINGYESLTHALYSTRKCGFQIQYQIIFCMWLLTFNGNAAEMALSGNLIQTISGILGTCQKEEVIRIVVAALRNLIASNTDEYMKKQAALQMIQNRVPTKLDHLANRKFEDVDMIDDIYLNTELKKVVQVLTSFDEYESELRLGLTPLVSCTQMRSFLDGKCTKVER